MGEPPQSPLDTSCQEVDDNDDSITDGLNLDGSVIRNRGSLVWQHFVCRRTCAVCKLCRKSLKRSGGNTSNLFQHLKRAHRRQYSAMMEQYRHRKLKAAISDMVRLPWLFSHACVVHCEPLKCASFIYATADEADAYMFYRCFSSCFFCFFRSPQKNQTTVLRNG